MTKRYVKSDMTPEMLAQLDRLAAMPDEDIDLSDMPEVTDWSGAVQGKFYRPAERRIDVRVRKVRFSRASLIVDLMDGRTISAPLAWYPRLLRASPEQRARWEKAGAGFGIHWPEIDEDLSTEGLLRGAPAAGTA